MRSPLTRVLLNLRQVSKAMPHAISFCKQEDVVLRTRIKHLELASSVVTEPTPQVELPTPPDKVPTSPDEVDPTSTSPSVLYLISQLRTENTNLKGQIEVLKRQVESHELFRQDIDAQMLFSSRPDRQNSIFGTRARRQNSIFGTRARRQNSNGTFANRSRHTSQCLSGCRCVYWSIAIDRQSRMHADHGVVYRAAAVSFAYKNSHLSLSGRGLAKC